MSDLEFTLETSEREVIAVVTSKYDHETDGVRTALERAEVSA